MLLGQSLSDTDLSSQVQHFWSKQQDMKQNRWIINYRSLTCIYLKGQSDVTVIHYTNYDVNH